MQRHVDAGADAGGCHYLALIDESHIVQNSDTGERAVQVLNAAPVGRDPMALQQTSPAQQEGSCADRSGESGLGVLGTNPVDQPGVIDGVLNNDLAVTLTPRTGPLANPPTTSPSR